jgi:hypothetical protein
MTEVLVSPTMTNERKQNTLKCVDDHQIPRIAGKDAPTQAAWKQAASSCGTPRWLRWKKGQRLKGLGLKSPLLRCLLRLPKI